MRVCFQRRIHPELIEEYVERHRAVWPTMLRAIQESGRRNYSLFLRPDGMLIGYYEVDDDAASAEFLARSTDAQEWEKGSAQFFVDVEPGAGTSRSTRLTEVFNLSEQLGERDEPPEPR